MRTLIILLSIFQFSTLFGQGEPQRDSLTTEGIYIIVEVLPSYDGGIKRFYKDLNKELNFPKNINGSIWVKTRIDSSGTLTILGIEKGISTAIDNKIVNAISVLQNWNAGETQNKSISAFYPIYLVIENGKIKK